MGISSLGVGSSILTQDVLDQLREADEMGRINPIKFKIADQKDQKDSMKVVDASMKNLTDSIDEIKSLALFDERKSDVTGSSVEITASSNTDVQDFSISVSQLATKQIEETGAFSTRDAKIADGAGSMNINIDGKDFTIDYDENTTLNDLKTLINDNTDHKIDATIVQIADGEFRMFMSSSETGASQNITITDNSAKLKGTELTDTIEIQTAQNAEFLFNSQAITRESNSVNDLIVGLDITLKEVDIAGSVSTVSISQDRESILGKMKSFVDKYNGAISELDKLTKSSMETKDRGIFSGESSIKNLKRAIQDAIGSIGGGVGTMADYGFDVDKEGVLSFKSSTFEDKLDANPDNVKAFMSGGTFKHADGTTTEIKGAFVEFDATMDQYTKNNAILDQFKTSLSDNIRALEKSKLTATERLDAKYEIMKKQFAAYDLMISKLNSASSMFTQMANAQIASSK